MIKVFSWVRTKIVYLIIFSFLPLSFFVFPSYAATLFADSFTAPDNTSISVYNDRYQFDGESVYVLNNKITAPTNNIPTYYNYEFPKNLCMSLTYQFPLTMPVYMFIRKEAAISVGAYIEVAEDYRGSGHLLLQDNDIRYATDWYTNIDAVTPGEHIFKLCGKDDQITFYLDDVLLSETRVSFAWQHGGSVWFYSGVQGVDNLSVEEIDPPVTPTATPIHTPTPTPKPTKTPDSRDLPRVTMLFPLSNTKVYNNKKLTLLALIINRKKLKKVEFYVNGKVICTNKKLLNSCEWKVPKGKGVTYKIMVKAYDNNGKVGESKTITVTSR